MGKAPFSIKANALWEDAISFSYLAAIVIDLFKKAEQDPIKNSQKGPPNRLGLKKSPFTVSNGQKKAIECPLHTVNR